MALLAACAFSCSSSTDHPNEKEKEEVADSTQLVDPSWKSLIWEFDSTKGWKAEEGTFSVESDALVLSTSAGTDEKAVAHTSREDLGEGLYSWTVNIPQLSAGDNVCTDAYIYQSDSHRLGFEIGYGTNEIREKAGARAGELVLRLFNAGFPYTQKYVTLKPGTHTLSLSLLLQDGSYTARWLVDGKIVQKTALMFGSGVNFRIVCGVVNGSDMGEHLPLYSTTARFESVSFTGPAAENQDLGDDNDDPTPTPTPTPTPDPDVKETRWDFDNIDGWYYFTHNPDQAQQYYFISNGMLYITTKGYTSDRNKLQSYEKDFGAASYTWRLYVPEVEAGAQLSVGAFIYCDDEHELDFEIGYGSTQMRTSCGAGETDLVACLTNQANPYNSSCVPISVGWHICTIDMQLQDGYYKAVWLIDGTQVKTLPVNFGDSYRFQVICSVENLLFMGDHQPTRDHTAIFDYVSVKEKK